MIESSEAERKPQRRLLCQTSMLSEKKKEKKKRLVEPNRKRLGGQVM